MGRKFNRFQAKAMQKAASGIKLMSTEQQQKFVADNLHLMPPEKRRELVEKSVRKDFQKFAKKGKTVAESVDAVIEKVGEDILTIAGLDRFILVAWAEDEGCQTVARPIK